MSYLEDFNNFQSEFLYLISLIKISKNMWKKELYDKLYKSLKMIIRSLEVKDNISFTQYCKETQSFTWELTNVVKEHFEQQAISLTSRSLKLAKLASSFKIKITVTITKELKVLTQTLRSLKSVTNMKIKCYWCGKLDYIAFEYSQKKTEAKMLEKINNMSFDESNESNSNISDLENE